MAVDRPAPPDKRSLQLSRSTIFPLVGGRSAWSQEHLLPIVGTILVGLALIVLLGADQGTDDDKIQQARVVFWIIGIYIAFLVNCYAYEMCSRARPWWLITAVAAATALLIGTPVWHYWAYLFYEVIPAARWQKATSVAVQLCGWFFGTGLAEEGFKALPLVVLALVGAGLAVLAGHTKGRLSALLAGIQRRVSLSEPLDGIVLGVASGTGFFLIETMGQYVPATMKEIKDVGMQAFEGLLVLLARGLPDLAEHSAWSGLFGYFIGLSVLRPGMAIVLLPLGWASAAALHAGWDGINAVTSSGPLILLAWLFLAVLSYALLAGAIFKAREISPTRAASPATARDTIPAPAPAPATEAKPT
jgi:RsiW-degrading membrane proteinase PrsW (M82 family)